MSTEVDKSSPAAQNVDGSSQKVSPPHEKLTKGLLAAQKVDRSGQKVYRLHKKWTEVDGRPPAQVY